MLNKIRYGMVGGGFDSMIGEAHRAAARLEANYELVCGTFSRDINKSKTIGQFFHLPSERVYTNYESMFEVEKKLPEDKRMQVVVIATPNHTHFNIAMQALAAGFHLILEKPITHTLQEAEQLKRYAEQTKRLCLVNYTYAGYPMVKEAKHIIQSGKLGKIRNTFVEFSQGWLAKNLNGITNKQADWRMDPTQSGPSGTIADIGTHAFHLLEYLTNSKVRQLCAHIGIGIPAHHTLEDHGAVLLKLDNNINGILLASQIATGETGHLKIRIDGELGNLTWEQNNPHTLILKWLDQPTEIWSAGTDHAYLSKFTREHCRLPAGHPEGFIGALANHYRNFALTLNAKAENMLAENEYPNLSAGVRGMAFVEAVVASAKSNEKWTTL